jgi:preprotein translocase subunit YajC
MLITSAYASKNDTIAITESESLPKAPEKISSSWTNAIPMVLIFAVFYFLLIRPQDKRRKQQQELVNTVKKGEEVVTSSGIVGIVHKLYDNENMVEIEIAKDVRIKILKSAIIDISSRRAKEDKKKKNQDSKGASSDKAS